MTADGKVVLCEVGVGPPGMAFILLVMDSPNIEILAFEPHPVYYAEVKAAVGTRPHVKLHNVAIGDEPGTLELFDEGTSSSLVGVSSPSVQHKGAVERKGFTVDVRRISDYDHGQIDILRVDTEGAEWFCIKHLVSRPKKIVVEIYNHLASYVNPHLWEIEQWCAQNGYRKINIVEGDFIYEREQAVPIVSGGQIEATACGPLPPHKDIAAYERMVKGTIIASFTTAYLNDLSPDEFVRTLNQVFLRKQKVFSALAKRVKWEVEAKGRPSQAVLQMISFYGLVLKEYLHKTTGQPVEGRV